MAGGCNASFSLRIAVDFSEFSGSESESAEAKLLLARKTAELKEVQQQLEDKNMQLGARSALARGGQSCALTVCVEAL